MAKMQVMDGFVGTIKRLASMASLQNPYEEQIMTPRKVYEWAVVKILSSPFSTVLLKTTAKKH
jgi:hypothetical protein